MGDLLTNEEFELMGDGDAVGGSFDGLDPLGEFGRAVEGESEGKKKDEKTDEEKAAEETAAKEKEQENAKAAPATIDIEAILEKQAGIFQGVLNTVTEKSAADIKRLETMVEEAAKKAPTDKTKLTKDEEIIAKPTDAEWRDDENAAGEKLYKHFRQKERIKEREEAAAASAKEEAASKEVATEEFKTKLKTVQDLSWEKAKDFNPDLKDEAGAKDDPNHIRNVTAAILQHPDLDLINHPAGPYIAGIMAVPIAERMKANKQAAAEALEKSRKDRLKGNHQEGSKEKGGDGDQQKDADKLDQDDLDIINMMGINKKTYIESRKQLGG